MKVALIHDWLTGMRGGEKCLEVFCELFPNADLYTLIYQEDRISPTIRSMRHYSSWINQLPAVRKYYRHCLPLFPRTIEGFDLTGYDLVLSSSHCVAKGVVCPGGLHISYVYSPMRYIWDMHDAYFTSDASWISRTGIALCRRYLQHWDVLSTERVDYLIAISHHIAGKIRKIYNREAAVIHPPVDVDRFRLGERQEPYYLIVSALVPYKKINIAIEAFNRLKLPLKIAGEGPLRRRLEKQARPNVEFLGWVSDQALASLYAACQALVFPGEEDFGIVPLEAQASGRPVIAYGGGGALETIAPLSRTGTTSPTGIFFDELTPESLIAAVQAFQQQRHHFDPAAIRRHSCRFSRDRFKVQIRDYIAACMREQGLGKLSDVKTP
jgi:glycosyltransferase involved in cell wall biosynthesis